MDFCGYTSFSNETRLEFIEHIFDRMDTVYSNWLYGEYHDSDLQCVLDDDHETNEMIHMFEILHYKFRPELVSTHLMTVDKWDWLADRLEMTYFPRRQTCRGIIIDCDSESDDFDDDSIPVLEPQNQAFVNVILGIGSDAHAPRRSARVKKQREFYYGF